MLRNIPDETEGRGTEQNGIQVTAMKRHREESIVETEAQSRMEYKLQRWRYKSRRMR